MFPLQGYGLARHQDRCQKGLPAVGSTLITFDCASIASVASASTTSRTSEVTSYDHPYDESDERPSWSFVASFTIDESESPLRKPKFLSRHHDLHLQFPPADFFKTLFCHYFSPSHLPTLSQWLFDKGPRVGWHGSWHQLTDDDYFDLLESVSGDMHALTTKHQQKLSDLQRVIEEQKQEIRQLADTCAQSSKVLNRTNAQLRASETASATRQQQLADSQQAVLQLQAELDKLKSFVSSRPSSNSVACQSCPDTSSSSSQTLSTELESSIQPPSSLSDAESSPVSPHIADLHLLSTSPNQQSLPQNCSAISQPSSSTSSSKPPISPRISSANSSPARPVQSQTSAAPISLSESTSFVRPFESDSDNEAPEPEYQSPRRKAMRSPRPSRRRDHAADHAAAATALVGQAVYLMRAAIFMQSLFGGCPPPIVLKWPGSSCLH